MTRCLIFRRHRTAVAVASSRATSRALVFQAQSPIVRAGAIDPALASVLWAAASCGPRSASRPSRGWLLGQLDLKISMSYVVCAPGVGRRDVRRRPWRASLRTHAASWAVRRAQPWLYFTACR